MIWTNLRLYSALLLALCAAAPCRADLFASMSSGAEILRIDSTTGNVTHTYPLPPFVPLNGAVTMGLAFDGRILYMTRRTPPFDQLFQLDVVDEIWFPPVVLDTFANPSGQPQPISGLGFLPGDNGFGSLIAVSRNPVDAPPSYIFKYDIFYPGFPDPLINVNFPVGELPSNIDAQGADVDSATGDLWIAADEIVGSTRTARLLRTDLGGNVLQTLTPVLDPPTVIRGVGFDGGGMFIAGRHLPTLTNNIYEIDRTTGAVLHSFALPGPGIVGALTGGAVIPEPGTGLLAALAIAGVTTRRRPIRRQ